LSTATAYKILLGLSEFDYANVIPAERRVVASSMLQHLHDSRGSKILQSAIRAGEIAQVLFLALLEHTWAYDIGHVRIVRNEDNQLIRIEVVDGLGVTAGPQGQSTCDRHAEGWLIEFPSKEFKVEDADAMRAVLTDHNSTWAFVCMHVAVQVLFERKYRLLLRFMSLISVCCRVCP
jgi:hypothetical protein